MTIADLQDAVILSSLIWVTAIQPSASDTLQTSPVLRGTSYKYVNPHIVCVCVAMQSIRVLLCCE